MKKWWFGSRAPVDVEQLRLKAQAKKDLRTCIELNDEAGYVALVKAINTELTPEDLIRLIECFRVQVAEWRMKHL